MRGQRTARREIGGGRTQPDGRLVRLHSNNGGAGFYIWPVGGRVSDEVAQLLLARTDVQPYDSGLFPGHPQSWRLGNWRGWGRTCVRAVE